MRRPNPPDPYLEAKLLGILLAGAFGQTRADCALEARRGLELRPSGIQRIALPDPDKPRG